MQKKQIIRNHILYYLSMSTSLYAAPGCLEKSYHLTQPNDPKEYHLVLRTDGENTYCCPCPCKKVSLDRGKCFECQHYRYFRPMYVVQESDQRNPLFFRPHHYQPISDDQAIQIRRIISMPRHHFKNLFLMRDGINKH